MTDEEISKLFAGANKIQSHFSKLYEQDEFSMTLDIEFKIDGPLREIFFKQIRPYVAQWQ